MISKKNHIDQRKHPRSKVVDWAVAALGTSRCGFITDISEGGLALRYVDYGNKSAIQKNTVEVSVINNSGFFLHSARCKIIMEDPASPENINFLRMKKCSIQFGELTTDQKSQLEYFIAHFTNNSIPTQLFANHSQKAPKR